MKTHRVPLPVVLGVVVLLALAGSSPGQERQAPPALTRELAADLIAEFYQVGENEIRVAYVLQGRAKSDGFESDVAAEVTFLRTVVEDGTRRRRVFTLRFLHDAALGWFLRQVVDQHGRTFIDICSEHRGRIRIE